MTCTNFSFEIMKMYLVTMSSAVAELVEPLPYIFSDPGSILTFTALVWKLRVLSAAVWVCSKCSNYLPHSKNC